MAKEGQRREHVAKSLVIREAFWYEASKRSLAFSLKVGQELLVELV